MQKLAEVGTHKAGHQSNFVEDKAPPEQEFLKIKCNLMLKLV